MPVKITKVAQNSGIWFFKGQGNESIFLDHKQAPPLMKIGLAV